MKYKFFITILLALFLSSQLFAETKERSPNFIEKFFIEKFGKEEDKEQVYEQENNAKAEEKIYKTTSSTKNPNERAPNFIEKFFIKKFGNKENKNSDNKIVKIPKPVRVSTSNNDISFYTGQFDIKDEKGDDETSLFGLEHQNPNLFRNTFLGKFSPVTGAFMTGKGAAYLYTGVEAQYGLGPLKISPSFAPGYYRQGGGKNLGKVLEFKSEIKIGFDLFENSSLGYSYSHISNNNWGTTNPGSDNQSLKFSKKF